MLRAIIPIIDGSWGDTVTVGTSGGFRAGVRGCAGLAAYSQITKIAFTLERRRAFLTKALAPLFDANSPSVGRGKALKT